MQHVDMAHAARGHTPRDQDALNSMTSITMKTVRPARNHRRATASWIALAALSAISHGVQADNALARKNGCLGCHAVATRLVGPSYQEVASKYAGRADALPALMQSIREGGSGKWGDVPMPPQPQLSQADVKRLAAWIAGGAK